MSCVVATDTQEEAAAASTCTINAAAEGISVSVDATKKTAMFVCDTDIAYVWPNPTTNEVITYFTTTQLDKTASLDSIFGKGSKLSVTDQQKKAVKGNATKAVLTVGALPPTTTAIYFACGTEAQNVTGSGGVSAGTDERKNRSGLEVQSTGLHGYKGPGGNGQSGGALGPPSNVNVNREVGHQNNNPSPKHCVVTVKVPADPKATTCTVKKNNMNLQITSETKSVSFQCDTPISTLLPQDTSDSIFDESCKISLKLSEKLPSAKLATTATGGYTFSVEELPDTQQTLCYKCSSLAANKKELQTEEENVCTVKIEVATADTVSDASASVATVSLPALAFGVVISSFFSTIAF
ncbi:UNVERIFIED_CONTAM: SAG-related sequence SRS52F [Hammondia hammondi]|eukprot:XP_008883415.1 SAG-related sequence SRS52F [Hammondia hammondi]